MAKGKKKGKGIGLIVVLAIAAIASSFSGDKKGSESIKILPVETYNIENATNARSIPAETENSQADTLAYNDVLVTLSPEIAAESLTLDTEKINICIGEKARLLASVFPEDVTDKTIIWTSSNSDIVFVDNDGIVSAIAPGSAEITAAASNGVSASASVEVNGSQRTVSLKFGCSRLDNNNIGNEWTYQYKINGQPVKHGDFLLKVGDVLNLSAEFTESDTKPDIGKASKTHIVSSEDLTSGFTEEMNLSVIENGGKNYGKSADFLVTFSFELK